MDPTSARRQFLKFLSGSPLLAIPGFAAWAAETPSRFPDPILWAPFNPQDLIANPKDAINVFDFEPVARKNVPPAHFGYMASGIDDEVTLRANREGFLKFQLRPRRLNDVSKVDMSVELFGTRLDNPIIIAPTGATSSFIRRVRSRSPRRLGRGITWTFSRPRPRAPSKRSAKRAARRPGSSFMLRPSGKSRRRS